MGAVDEVFLNASVRASTRPKLTLNWGGKCAPVPDVVFVDAVSPATLAAAAALAVAQDSSALRVDPWTEPAPLDICLAHWTDWMKQDDRDLGAKSQAGILSEMSAGNGAYDGEGDSAASGAAAARASREIALATDAMINSLPRDYKAAIWRRCNIASVWRFPTMDFSEVLPLAEKCLDEKLSKNVATRAFW